MGSLSFLLHANIVTARINPVTIGIIFLRAHIIFIPTNNRIIGTTFFCKALLGCEFESAWIYSMVLDWYSVNEGD